MNKKILSIPLIEEEIRDLRIGDVIYLKGLIFTSRDMGHIEIEKKIKNNEELPVNFNGSAVFHAGPIVSEKGNGKWDLVVVGPTSSIRMETYAEMIGKLGVRAIIGKGGMGEETLNACQKYGAVYLQAAPGCAAIIAKGIESIENVYWLGLGIPEALWVFKANMFGPLTVAMDTHGRSIYKELKENALNKVKELYGEL